MCAAAGVCKPLDMPMPWLQGCLTPCGRGETVRLIGRHDGRCCRDLDGRILMVVRAVTAKQHGLRAGGRRGGALRSAGQAGGKPAAAAARRRKQQQQPQRLPSTCQAAIEAGSLLARVLPVCRPDSSGLLLPRGVLMSAMAGTAASWGGG